MKYFQWPINYSMDNQLEDAPRDPRAYQAFRQGYTEKDFEGNLNISSFLKN